MFSLILVENSLLNSVISVKYYQSFNKGNLYCSGTVFYNETTLIIIGNDGWNLATNYNFCEGNGTLSNPYLINNLTLTNLGIGYCIRIRDSDVNFIITNCSVSNATYGIMLINVYNGKLINNTSYSNHYGVYLENSHNINISSNFVYSNKKHGIYTYQSNENIIVENFVNNNLENAINLEFSNLNKILINRISYNDVYGLKILYFSIKNTVIGNNISYNKDDGIIVGFESNNNNITDNKVLKNAKNGINIIQSDLCDISRNNVSFNYGYGIKLQYSNKNFISHNYLFGNNYCINEENCVGNEFKDNFPCFYNEGRFNFRISGYELFFLVLGFYVSLIILVLNITFKKAHWNIFY
ncbi:MAG: nitrous oxide reductase family maturation protein NosD [Promethearchaeota archaeon]